ncbi:unnamed protein product, partial [Cladocopium goreaui]
MALAASSGRLGVDASLELSSDENGGFRLPWGIRKRLLQKGISEERPISGDEVKVHLQGKLQDGNISITSSDEAFTFVIDQRPREVIQGLELGVQTMTKGEVAEFTIAPRFAYDDLGAPPLVPPDATLVFEVELMDWENKSDVLGDGRAIKTITERGSGKMKPQKGQDVVLSMKVTSRKGAVLQEHVELEHTVGAPDFGTISPIILEVLRSMSQGERCHVLLRRFASDKIVDTAHSGADVDLTLVRIFEISDISPEEDGTLMKKFLSKGGETGETCRAFDEVVLQVDQVTDGAKDVKFSGCCVLDFPLGRGVVCDALDFAAATMCVGEEAKLICSAPLNFQEARLGLDSCVEKAVIKVKLTSLRRGPHFQELQDSALTTKIDEAKDAAATLFKTGRFALALEVYRRLSASLDGKSEVQKVQSICELNQAACYLKLAKPHRAKELCDRVLEKEPGQVKALYRRASAEFQLSNFAAAMKDLTALLKVQPNNSEARAMVEQLREAQREYTKEAKAAASRMLGEKADA